MALLSAAAAAQAAGGQVRVGVLVRVGSSDGPLRLWSGVGELDYGPDNIETTSGAAYAGFGELLPDGLQALQGLINGAAQRVDFSLAGSWLSPDIVKLANWHAAAIRSAFVNVALVFFDQDWQLFDSAWWVWTGIADTLSVDRRTENGESVRALHLSAGSLFTGRRRPSNSQWTDPAQRQVSPTDSFCMYVANLNAGSTRVWPSY